MTRDQTQRRIAVIDFEASALVSAGAHSFPIEVAIGFPETGAVQTWLIRPEPAWLKSWTWDPAAERLHGLSRDHLLAHGRPREEVARAVLAALKSREPLSDNPSFDQYWLWVLTGRRYSGVRIGAFGALLDEIAGGGLVGRTMLELAQAEARREASRTHRAGDDVRHLLAILRALLRLSKG